MPLDILILAAIAVGLFIKLWSVLGTRHEDEPQRLSVLTMPQPRTAPAAPTPVAAPILPPDSLAGGLAQIAARDPDFNEKQFLSTARSQFTAVIAAYAAGDLHPVVAVLSPTLRAHLDSAIAARRALGQTAETRILAISDADCVAAKVDGETMLIKVRIVSLQENVLRDAQGAVVGGTPGRNEEVTDSWLFSRVLTGAWIVAQTGV